MVVAAAAVGLAVVVMVFVVVVVAVVAAAPGAFDATDAVVVVDGAAVLIDVVADVEMVGDCCGMLLWLLW